MNAVEIESAVSDLALHPFDREEFPFAFLAAFGNKDTTIKRLRKGESNASDLPGGVLQRNNIHIAVCDAGAVGATLKALRESPKTSAAKARFALATDSQTLEAEDMASGETIACGYPEFSDHFGFFLPLAGISTIKEIKDNPIDVRATGRLNKLYVELLKGNREWATEARRHDMNHFMARLVFCFFAEDTDIFPGEGLFTRTVEQMGERDGSNTHEVLEAIFRAMNVKISERADGTPRLPNWAHGFPYVNGGLFSGSTDVPRFTRMARTFLLHAGSLRWREIMDALGAWKGVDPVTGFHQIELPAAKGGRIVKVADLVDDGDAAKRSKVLQALKDPAQRGNRDHLGIIIALGMAKEGFDWIWCEHALTIGYRSSLTEIVQIIGRSTRDAPGKETARFTNLIAAPDATEAAVVDAVNDTLKAIAASLLMEQVLAPRFEFTPKNMGPQVGFSY